MATKKKQENFFKKLSTWFQREGKNFRPSKKQNKKKERKLPQKCIRKSSAKECKFLSLLITCLVPVSSLLGGFYEEGSYQGFYFFEEKATKEEKQKINHLFHKLQKRRLFFSKLRKSVWKHFKR